MTACCIWGSQRFLERVQNAGLLASVSLEPDRAGKKGAPCVGTGRACTVTFMISQLIVILSVVILLPDTQSASQQGGKLIHYLQTLTTTLNCSFLRCSLSSSSSASCWASFCAASSACKAKVTSLHGQSQLIHLARLRYDEDCTHLPLA